MTYEQKLAKRVKELERRVDYWRTAYREEADENTGIREALGLDVEDPDETLSAKRVRESMTKLEKSREWHRISWKKCRDRAKGLESELELAKAHAASLDDALKLCRETAEALADRLGESVPWGRSGS